MTAKKAAAYSGGGLLLLAWLASASGVGQHGPAVESPSPVETSGTATLASEVQAQTERLRTRMSSAPAPQTSSRNPFAFAPREAPKTALTRQVRERVDEVAAPIGAPDEPAIDLVGVAENQSPKGLERTAIISAFSGELFLVKEGELIAARYRVKAVGADAVELIDLVSGSTRRLALRE